MSVARKTETLPKMTFDEFMLWYETQEGRWELHDGVPVRKHDPARGQSERMRHLKVKHQVARLLEDAVATGKQPCFMLPDGATVKIEERQSYEPDALVYCGEEVDDDALAVENPLIIVEVLSPGTRGKDLGDKLHDYFTLSSVQHYLIIDPEKRVVSHYQRHDDGKDGRLLHIHHKGNLNLTPPDITLAVRDIFATLS